MSPQLRKAVGSLGSWFSVSTRTSVDGLRWWVVGFASVSIPGGSLFQKVLFVIDGARRELSLCLVKPDVSFPFSVALLQWIEMGISIDTLDQSLSRFLQLFTDEELDFK